MQTMLPKREEKNFSAWVSVSCFAISFAAFGQVRTSVNVHTTPSLIFKQLRRKEKLALLFLERKGTGLGV